MSRTVGGITEDGYCFPRVSGDEPTSSGSGGSQGKFSPRERG